MYEQAYRDIGKGLRLVFFGQILAVLSSFNIPLIGPFLSLAGLVLTLVGLSSAGRGDSGYRSAFTITIVNLTVTFAALLLFVFTAAFLPTMAGVLTALIVIANSVLGFLEVYYICSASAGLLGEREPALSVRAVTVWKLYGLCIALLVICGLLTLSTSIMSGGLSLLSFLAQAAAEIPYLLFLYRASDVFQSW